MRKTNGGASSGKLDQMGEENLSSEVMHMG